MPIPDFQDLMLPILKALSGGNEMSVSDIRSRVAAELGLTDQDLAEWLPSGSDLVFDSRAAVIRLYLKKAGLIEPVRRGVYKVTSQGLQLLASEPARIDLSTLKHYPSFRDYWNGVSAAGKEVSPSDQKPAEQENPREILEAAHKKLQAMLADELLATVRAMSPRRFEKLVLELLVKMGFGKGTPGRGVRDGGIDGIIIQDPLGLDTICIQAKRWEAGVGRPEVQGFVGSLQGRRAWKGVFVTTSHFTNDAREYVKAISDAVVLVDGKRLAELMISHNVGVEEDDDGRFIVKRIDHDYFDEEE